MLEGHTDSVGVLDAIYIKQKGSDDKKILTTFIASASVDSTVRIWTRKSDEESTDKAKFTQLQCLTAKGNGFALALKFYRLPLSECNKLILKSNKNIF